MRTIATILGLSFLILSASAATSSSVAASSSSKAATTSSSSVSISYTGNNTLTYGECTPGSGGDAPCTAINADWCCYYSWYQYTGESMVTSYECAMNPSKESLLSDAENLATSAYSDVAGSSGYSSGGYCANSVFVRVSMAVAALGLTSLFF
jgi:hypothetical protein